jgi:hypothetical protein
MVSSIQKSINHSMRLASMSPITLAYEIDSLFGHYRVSMCKKIWLKER